MPSTSYADPIVDFEAWTLQARTDSGGSPVTDADGEEARLPASLYTGGVVQSDAYAVNADSPVGMTVVVGSGTANRDVAVVEGTAPGQGNYLVRASDATTDVTVPAADVSNPRIDEVYLIVVDDTYDTGGLTLPRFGYRQGDPASSPSPPGPDSSWDAFLLLATINVGASVTAIEAGDISDGRVQARLADNLVATGSIQNEAVTNAKLADNSVTPGKLDEGAVIASRIGDLQVQTAKLATNAVTVDKLASALQNLIVHASGQGRTIYVQSGTPSNPVNGDIWIEI